MSAALDARLRALYEQADDRFRARSTRERLLLAAGLLAVTAFLIDASFLRPIERERQRVATATRARHEEIRHAESRLDAIRHPVLDAAERARLDERRQLEQQISEIDGRIRSAVTELVPPESAVAVLEALLGRSDGLELVRLTSAPPRPLGAEPSERAGMLFQHGITLEIEGDFASTLDYVRRIERAPWQLLWDRLDYRVERFPKARVTIELHTLSQMEAWFGV
ncbi:MAG: hypothetical protein R3F35_16060 [Myxococcota bacterium]